MVSRERSAAELLRRYASFVIVLFVIAFGTSLSIRANLGSSPISCPPYVLSLLPGAWTMGKYVMCMHIFFILSQILLLRSNYEKIQLLQILVSFLFGWYTDLTMWLTAFLQVPADWPLYIAWPLRFIELLAGGAILAYGISCEVHCDVLMLAGEGFPLAVSKVLKRDFGKVKMCTDTGLVCVGTVIMLVTTGSWHWDMVGVGTLVSMFFVGFMVRQFNPCLGWLDRFLTASRQQHEADSSLQPPATEAAGSPLVITISREFGSGGHAIGEKLAHDLGVKLYDRKLIDKTAHDLGFSAEYVAENEQNISTTKLWELIFTDKSIPASMNPSHDDAIFVSQSRTIRELASEGPCVIVGRLANYILRDNPHVFNVFVTSSRNYAVERISSLHHIDAKVAQARIEQVNRGRANHCFQYTGRRWADARCYDLVVDTSKVGIDGASQLIGEAVRLFVREKCPEAFSLDA